MNDLSFIVYQDTHEGKYLCCTPDSSRDVEKHIGCAMNDDLNGLEILLVPTSSCFSTNLVFPRVIIAV